MAEKELNGVKLDKIAISFQLDDNSLIDGAVVKPLTFRSSRTTSAKPRT